MAQEIVFYHSAQTGAPSGTLNVLGGALAVLDACLVNGFNSNTVSTLTQAAGVATATTSGTNGFSVGEWVQVAGATPSAYNGRVKVTGKPAANQFTYDIASGTTSPATLSSATAGYPGAGWTKSVLGTNIAAYQGGAGSLGLWMQVEDNNPYADSNVGIRTRLAQGLSGLDSATVIGTQVNIAKNTGGWILFADAKTCYLFMGAIASSGSLLSFAFGEIASFYSGDSFSIFQNVGRSSGNAPTYYEQVNQGYLYGGSYWPATQGTNDLINTTTGTTLRGISQIGGSVNCGPVFMGSRNSEAETSGGGGFRITSQLLLVPSLADNSIPVVPIFNHEYTAPNFTLRGRHRGIYMPLGRLSGGFVNSFQRLDNAMIDGVSQSLVLVNTNNFGGHQLAFQVDGTWG